MKTRTLASLSFLVFYVLITIVMPWSQGQSDDSDTTRPTGKVIFEIGQEDKKDLDFRRVGFGGQPEYTCRVGVDCSTEAFPQYLYLAPNGGYADNGVERITISFTLDQKYKKVVLRLARGGDETTFVVVDGKRKHRVTNTMLGSGENYHFGVYNLKLGALKKGTHTIEMTVADDGKGNDAYKWDALSLFAR